jgi:Uma2 family endonuclease
MFIEDRGLGRLTINKVAYRLSEDTAPEPDLALVASDPADRIKHGYIDGPPDFAIEIVSPDSVDRDYKAKRRRYEDAGVREYWIIDPMKCTATFLVREGDAFVERVPENHLYKSRVLDGLELDVRWFWQRPLPPTMPIVRSLLGEV